MSSSHYSILMHLLLIHLLILIQSSNGLRINSLIELQHDSSSITIEWSISETSLSSSADPKAPAETSSPFSSTWIGFKIKYFTDKLQYTPILLKNVLFRKFRLDNLKSNTEYRIQVSAYNSAGDEGPASQLLAVKTYEAGGSLF
jgi:hypothetical protein